MNIIEDMNQCYGCSACYNACPFGAIKMVEDKEGFLKPVVDFYACKGCEKCRQVCPRLNPKYPNLEHPEAYALIAEDAIREASSSGGAFTLLAEYVLEKGGVVCGSALTETFEARHTIIDSMEGLNMLRKSKYVQSDIGSSYSGVKKYLDNGRWVLFTGTPCQVAGLYGFLGKPYTNLLTADIICHGTPSPKVWRKFLNSVSGGKEIKNVEFRTKSVNGWNSGYCLKLEYSDGTNQIVPKEDYSYSRAFLRNKTSRLSCFSCQYARFPRQGDFTIGDFWGVDSFDKTLNDKKGTSVIIVNNKKSQSILDSWLVKSSAVLKEVPLDVITKKNTNLYRFSRIDIKRQTFIDSYLSTETFDEAEKLSTGTPFDVGIISWFYATNYGAVLTSYALTRALKYLGYSSTLIDIPDQFWSKSSHLREPLLFSKRFIYKYCDVSKQLNLDDEADIRAINRNCRSFAVASDQLWRWDKIKSCYEFFFLGFANEKKKKFSYSTSFGGARFSCDDENKLAHVKEMINSFAGVSVREKNGLKICKDKFGIDAVHVLDPVFLCDTMHYDVLSSHSKVTGKRFVVAYMLAYSDEKNRVLNEYAKMLNCEIILIPDATKGKTAEWSMPMTTDIEIEDFLYYIKNSKLVITDSFHAVCFSIIFGVNFIATSEGRAGKDRFTSILELTKIDGRLLSDFKEILNRPELITEDIDYSLAHKLLNREKIKSLNWLVEIMEK